MEVEKYVIRIDVTIVQFQPDNIVRDCEEMETVWQCFM
jgi:hypothetical protein